MEKEVGTVVVNLEEYKDFIISQYENGKLKSNLVQYIKDLKSEAQALEIEIQNAKNTLHSMKDTILELVFKRDRMGSDDRKEQTDFSKYNNYSGFSTFHREKLYGLGFTEDDLLAYINKQWDIEEQEEAAAKEDVEGESE